MMSNCKPLQNTQINDDTFNHPNYHYFGKKKEKKRKESHSLYQLQAKPM